MKSVAVWYFQVFGKTDFFVACVGELSCGGVDIFTFLLRPSLPCPALDLL